MHSVCVSSQLFVLLLFFPVPTDTENSKFFLTLFCVCFLAMQLNGISMCTIEIMLFFVFCTGKIMAWR